MTVLFISIVFDVTQVFSFVLIFFCYLGGINPSGWIASTTTAFIFLGSLGLRLISKKGIVRLILIFVLVRSFIAMLPKGVVLVFFCKRPIVFWVPEIDLLSPEKWLQAGFYFYIDSFLYYFTLRIQVSSSII